MGPSAGSEPEVKNVMNYLSNIKHNVKFYQSLHAYGQVIILPWGYTDEKNPDYDKMLDFGNKVDQIIFLLFLLQFMKNSSVALW